MSLSASVRHFARALGHLLVYCHWHSFSVLFDDSPSIIDTQGAWEEVLSQMTTRIPLDPVADRYYTAGGRGSGDESAVTTDEDMDASSNYTDYDYENGGGRDPFDGDDDPVLHPNYLTIQARDAQSAFRTLSEITKATQGVIVLLCSEKSVMRVFQAAKRLRMLNGDYIFILVGQYNEVNKCDHLKKAYIHNYIKP